MSTNQNITRVSSKRCSKKVLSIIALVIVSVFALAIPCSALTFDVDDYDYLYPTFSASIDYHFDDNFENDESVYLILGNNGSDAYNYAEMTYNSNIWVTAENNDGIVDIIVDDYIGDYDAYAEYDYFDTFSRDFKMFEFYEAIYSSDDYEPLPLYNIYVWDYLSGYNEIAYHITYDVTFYGINANGISSGLDYVPLNVRYTTDVLTTSSSGGTIQLALPQPSDVLPLLYDFYLDNYGEGVHFQYTYDELWEHDYETYLYDSEGNKILLDFKDILSIVNWSSYVSFSDTNRQNKPNKIQFECGITEENLILSGQESLADIYYEGVLTPKFDFELDSSNAETIADAIKDSEYPNTRLLGWLGSAVRGFLSVEIFPNFSIGAILGVVTMIPIVIWLLKLVAGG